MSKNRPHVTIVGLGPGDADLLTAGTLALLDAGIPTFVRTTRHPAAAAVPAHAQSFDHIYERADSFAEVYAEIVESVVAAAAEAGAVLYVVPGSPSVAERTVELLLADDRVQVTLVPALSFVDLTWNRLGIDPLAQPVTVVDGHRFGADIVGLSGPVLVAQCDQDWVLSEIKLTVDDPDDAYTVTILQNLGLADEQIVTVPWNELDRTVEANHLTSLWIPELPATVARAFAQFEAMTDRLRVECPWDAEQTHESLRRYLLEETYETLEAIDGVDVDAGTGYEHLAEELGDLLYQIFFHAVLASEEGHFTVADVAIGIHDKLYVRHPHVYGDVEVADRDEVVTNWEAIKKQEKGRSSVMEGIPEALPALLYALKVQKKASSQGFGMPDLAAALSDVDDELAEFREAPSPDELGDLLFAGVQVARQIGCDPEMELRDAARRFRDRFVIIEADAEASGGLVNLSADEQRTAWARAKQTVADQAR